MDTNLHEEKTADSLGARVTKELQQRLKIGDSIEWQEIADVVNELSRVYPEKPVRSGETP